MVLDQMLAEHRLPLGLRRCMFIVLADDTLRLVVERAEWKVPETFPSLVKLGAITVQIRKEVSGILKGDPIGTLDDIGSHVEIAGDGCLAELRLRLVWRVRWGPVPLRHHFRADFPQHISSEGLQANVHQMLHDQPLVSRLAMLFQPTLAGIDMVGVIQERPYPGAVISVLISEDAVTEQYEISVSGLLLHPLLVDNRLNPAIPVAIPVAAPVQSAVLSPGRLEGSSIPA